MPQSLSMPERSPIVGGLPELYPEIKNRSITPEKQFGCSKTVSRHLDTPG
jgi:hypothetical protein